MLARKSTKTKLLMLGLVLSLIFATAVIMTEQVEAMSSEMEVEEVPEGHRRIHYYRFDGDYRPWGLHAWGGAYDGPEPHWNEPLEYDGITDYGIYWDVPYDEDADGNLNFIIHFGDEQDPEVDRSFPNPEENKEIWTVSGDAEKYLSEAEARENHVNDFTHAIMIEETTLSLGFRDDIDDKEVINIVNKETGEEIELSERTETDRSEFEVVLADELDYSQDYKVVAEDMEKDLIPPAAGIDAEYAYDGDLGIDYSSDGTNFKLWSPIAEDVRLRLFDEGYQGDEPYETVELEQEDTGVWETTVDRDLEGEFYNYEVTIQGDTNEVFDPYAKSMAGFDSSQEGIGKGAIIDLDETDPEGWRDESPIELDDTTDAMIYEMSVRDFTINENSGVSEDKKGLYEGFIERIDHLEELGVTHVQLMPVMNFWNGNEFDREFEDFGSGGSANYNWGYDPHSYFSPTGWYATDPMDPEARVRELKELINALHDADIGVTLDVVYNHTVHTDILEPIMPYYFYRRLPNGNLSNNTGVGNDTESRNHMMRRIILDSVEYWMEEYNVDGYRFDLMGIHDEETMIKVRDIAEEINPNALIYGEGWAMTDEDTLPRDEAYIKGDEDGHRSLLKYDNAPGVFCDTIRDAIKQEGAFGAHDAGGFVQGVEDREDELRAGIIGGMNEFESEVEISDNPYDRYTNEPQGSLTYTSIHDGFTLWDKIQISAPDATEEEQKRMHKMAGTIVFTSQGFPIMHGGMEMLRTKPDPDSEENPYVDYADHGFDINSYDSGDLTNQLEWDRKDEYSDVFEFYQGLLELRQHYDGFRMRTKEDIQNHLEFIPAEGEIGNFVAYRLDYPDAIWEEVLVLFNSRDEAVNFAVDGVGSDWNVALDANNAGTEPIENSEVEIRDGEVVVPAISPVVIYRN